MHIIQPNLLSSSSLISYICYVEMKRKERKNFLLNMPYRKFKIVTLEKNMEMTNYDNDDGKVNEFWGNTTDQRREKASLFCWL